MYFGKIYEIINIENLHSLQGGQAKIYVNLQGGGGFKKTKNRSTWNMDAALKLGQN